MKKLVITGAGGLLGWHASVRIHAANCAARFQGKSEPFELVLLDRAAFNDEIRLRKAVAGAVGILHFAGVNRGTDRVIEAANPSIAQLLSDACLAEGATPHIVYANSIHAVANTPYGRSKRIAAEILSRVGGRFTDLVLPHIFGECARPRYNNVTATFIEAIISEKTPDINPDGKVALLHAGEAAQAAVDAIMFNKTGALLPVAKELRVADLYSTLLDFHTNYCANIFPDFPDPFTVALFNSYRTALYPNSLPAPLTLNTDARGTLFEAVKGGGGGQIFLSTTKPGITRGEHFHLNKVERFLVLQGEAIIRIRKVMSDEVWEYQVSGNRPIPIDMPTLHTHSIENIGDTDLLTLFWTHDLFDPDKPDTFAEKVLK